MNSRHRTMLTAMAITTLMVLAMLTTVRTAHAQPPPCGAPNLTIKNGTACTINFCLKGIGGVFCWTVPAGTVTVVPMPPGFVPLGVINTGNNTTYPFIPSGQPQAPWWVPNITLSGCCCDVLYDPSICVMWILNTTSPPPCQ
ncbi:MAG: hypothetical protein JST22_04465 [Bacteroidetes bacterium]|nr:hypothetical protein [Bacteroidota bacterium]